LFGDEKREKSPTAAVIDIATVTSTPGIVISRLVFSQPSATRARSASISLSSWPWKSS
jgi:hypothetical protein